MNDRQIQHFVKIKSRQAAQWCSTEGPFVAFDLKESAFDCRPAQRDIDQLSKAEWRGQFDDIAHTIAIYAVVLVTLNLWCRLVIQEIGQCQFKTKETDVNRR